MNMADTLADSVTIGYFEALGMITALSMASSYREWFVHDIERNLVPALVAGQCKIYLSDRREPTAFATWALLDEECHDALRLHGHNPPPDRWSCGKNLWFIDVVAPFGTALDLVRDLQRNHFFDFQRAYAIRRAEDGGIRRIQVWRKRVIRPRAE